MNLYLFVIPLDLMRLAHDSDQFETEEQRKDFEREAGGYLEDLMNVHGFLALLSVLGYSSRSVVKVFQELIEWESISSISSLALSQIEKIITLIVYVFGVGLNLVTLLKIFVNRHLRFQLINLGLTFGGIRNRILGIIMGSINIILALYFFMIRSFFAGNVMWILG